MIIICPTSNYKFYTLSLQMRLLDEQFTLPVYHSLGLFATRMISQKKQEQERKDSPMEETTNSCHTHLKKKEPIIAIWHLCSFRKLSSFKGADLAFRPALRTLLPVLAKELRSHATLLSCVFSLTLLCPSRSFSVSFLPPYSLQLWIQKGNKQLRCSVDWMRCVAWTTEG